MSTSEWNVFAANLNRVIDKAESHRLSTAIHPHWGMAIAGQNHVERLFECSEVGICLDTGHLYLAGCEPLEIAKLASSRINDVHLKDVDDTLAERVRSGELPFRQAVLDGLFKPLGTRWCGHQWGHWVSRGKWIRRLART
jgi:inosose dehydratase